MTQTSTSAFSNERGSRDASERVPGGPLAGLAVIEFAGIGPGPFATMMLADLGAAVIRIDRAGADFDQGAARNDVVSRGRRSIALDLKSPKGIEVARMLIRTADVLVEGFRPRVMERLGLGPEDCLTDNPQLVYGRMTGWGQSGPLAATAGHDINYISLTGALASIGREGHAPVPPLNLVGDYGGGGMLLAFGILAALFARPAAGGQVVDAAMVDGSATLMAAIYGLRANSEWSDRRGTNLLDSGTPYYDVYEAADGEYVAVGAIEAKFFGELLDVLELDRAIVEPMHLDRKQWPELRKLLTAAFRAKPRDAWAEIFDGRDACVTPVLSMREAPGHPHNVARANFVEQLGVVQPAPSPRYSKSATQVLSPPPLPGEHSIEILTELGFDSRTIQQMLQDGIIV